MTIKALLFDLGGVVITIDFNNVFSAWAQASGIAADNIKKRFRMDAAYNQFERGEITFETYAEHLRATIGFDLDNTTLLAGWNTLFTGTVTDVPEMIQRASQKITIHAFSNTNAAHHAGWGPRFADVLKPMHTIICSYQLGLRKPEAAAFQAVANRIQVRLEDMLFFDDTQENIDAAQALGIESVLVTSAQDIYDSLTKGGFIHS